MKDINKNNVEKELTSKEYNKIFLSVYLTNVSAENDEIYVKIDKDGFIDIISHKKIKDANVFINYNPCKFILKDKGEYEFRKFLLEDVLKDILSCIERELLLKKENRDTCFNVHYNFLSKREQELARDLFIFANNIGITNIMFTNNPEGFPFYDCDSLLKNERDFLNFVISGFCYK